MNATINVTRRRRDGLTIMAELLETMHQPIKLTHILYRTNLSHSQLKRYLDILASMEFVQELKKPNHGFVITEKGRTFVQLIASYSRDSSHEDPIVIPLGKIEESDNDRKDGGAQAEIQYDHFDGRV